MQIHKNDLISYAPYESGSLIDSAIVNGLVVEVIKIIIENNFTPPIFNSGNADDFTEHNSKLINKYKDRIPLLEEEAEIGIFSAGDYPLVVYFLTRHSSNLFTTSFLGL